MFALLSQYWPHILLVLSIVMGTAAAIHAAMTKRDVRSATGWVAVILLSPIIGALLYGVAGINRIRRASVLQRRGARAERQREMLALYDVTDLDCENLFGSRMRAMKTLGDRVAQCALTSGNGITILSSGKEAYDAICAAIDAASRSVILETYIFDRDEAGMRVADCLIAAHRRGVIVRVLIDAVGARYSVPSILGYLKDGGVVADAFNGNVIMGLRLPYANLRTHRKIIVVDGAQAFVGGMNIRAAFIGDHPSGDTHFRVTGPVVADLFSVAADDWHFQTGEFLAHRAWDISVDDAVLGQPVFVRAVVSGPDRNLETNHKLLMGAFSVAKKSIRIMSPYFLPDNELLSALARAARRGVAVDIVVPSQNNLALVSHAMTAQFEIILKDRCRLWRAPGRFNHSKLVSIDGKWAYVGSSNLDSRSLRLNFEIDLEIFDANFAATIDARIAEGLKGAAEVTMEELKARPFVVRLFDRVLWLGSPYL